MGNLLCGGERAGFGACRVLGVAPGMPAVGLVVFQSAPGTCRCHPCPGFVLFAVLGWYKELQGQR